MLDLYNPIKAGVIEHFNTGNIVRVVWLLSLTDYNEIM